MTNPQRAIRRKIYLISFRLFCVLPLRLMSLCRFFCSLSIPTLYSQFVNKTCPLKTFDGRHRRTWVRIRCFGDWYHPRMQRFDFIGFNERNIRRILKAIPNEIIAQTIITLNEKASITSSLVIEWRCEKCSVEGRHPSQYKHLYRLRSIIYARYGSARLPFAGDGLPLAVVSYGNMKIA